MMGQIAVCICTYRRPAQMSRLLDALTAIPRPPRTTFVIVDNGSGARTHDLVREFQERSGAPVIYVAEPEPGLSAARNAALRAARDAGADTVALLDDDEWPDAQWLTKLIETRLRTGAAVVGGPVYPAFEVGKAPPIKYQPLWSVQKGQLHGRTHVYCTCNCLIDLDAVAFLGDQPFSSAFGFTGGEDVVFFRCLHAARVRMAWSDEAVVFEDVSGERATLGWLRRRWYRLGNVGVRCERAAPVDGDFPPLAKTVLLVFRLGIYPFFNRRVFAAPLLWLLEAERVRGRLASHAGITVAQYAREALQRSCVY